VLPTLNSNGAHANGVEDVNGNNNGRKFSSLFNALKEQYLAAIEKQQKHW